MNGEPDPDSIGIWGHVTVLASAAILLSGCSALVMVAAHPLTHQVIHHAIQHVAKHYAK